MKYFPDVIGSNLFKHMLSVYVKCPLIRTTGIRTVTCLKSYRRAGCKQVRVRQVSFIGSKLSMNSLLNDFNSIQCKIVVTGKRTLFTSACHSQKTELEDLFPLRFMFIRTNVSFWEEYPEGINFDVGYVDTKLNKTTKSSNSNRNPVIVALPSSVGTHMELTETLMTFAKLGYRVVIPNLPVTKYCRGKKQEDEAVCQLSVQEKADFVKDFLRELGIEKVDMLITNGCSVYTGVSLCVFHTSMFKSLVMINPTGLEPTKSMLPLWVHKRYTSVFDNRFILQGLLKFIVGVCKKFTKKSHWDTLNVSTYSRTVSILSFKDEKTCAGYFKARSIPRFAIFGENTNSFDVKSTMDYLSLIDIPKSAIKEIDEQNKIKKEDTEYNGNYGLYIQGDGSEDILNKRTVLLRKELINILKLVQPDL